MGGEGEGAGLELSVPVRLPERLPEREGGEGSRVAVYTFKLNVIKI